MQKRSKLYRALELVPGVLLWGTFALAIILSIVKPLWVIYFIILFDLLWLFRVSYFIIFLLLGWRDYKNAIKEDWFKKLQTDYPDWKKITHLMFLPMYKEGEEIVRTTLDAILDSNYPADKFIIVLAGEERANDHFQPIAKKIKKEYGKKFSNFLVTTHPKDLPNEMASKGANIHYAGHEAKKLIDKLKLPYEDVIVSAFDIDTVAHKEYFACLTYKYLANPNRTHSSYQPVVLYNNNIWDTAAPMRLAAFSTTFWLLSELSRPDRLFTFSSHSMPFKALVDVGFWQKDIVSEDSRIFLQGFFRYNGNYHVTPIPVPVSMDTVQAKTQWRGIVNLYKQQRRWAWGVEHFPFMITKFLKNKNISLFMKLKYTWNQAEGMFTWATAPVLIFVLGRLPLLFIEGDDKATVLAQNAPFVLETLLNMTLVGVFVIAILGMALLPPRPQKYPPRRILNMIIQWILLPITLIVLSSIPAIDAQTRLMTGRYLGFWVTEKERKK